MINSYINACFDIGAYILRAPGEALFLYAVLAAANLTTSAMLSEGWIMIMILGNIIGFVAVFPMMALTAKKRLG